MGFDLVWHAVVITNVEFPSLIFFELILNFLSYNK